LIGRVHILQPTPENKLKNKQKWTVRINYSDCLSVIKELHTSIHRFFHPLLSIRAVTHSLSGDPRKKLHSAWRNR
jgi:hypothetical protein